MGSFLRSVTYNWQLKLLAMTLAVLLWVVVSAEQVTSNWIPVPLEVETSDPDFRLLRGSAPREVEVRFVGPGRELWDVAIRRPPLVLRLSEVEDTLQAFTLDPGMVLVPNHLSVNAQGVRPGRVRLRFEEQSTRNLPVMVQVERGPGSGLTLVDSLQVRPTHVEVSGPAERVARLQSVHTAAITLPSETATFDRLVALDLEDLGGLQLGTSRVRVSGRVERVVERTLADVPISVGPGVTIRPASVNVRVRGAENLVRELRASDLRVVLAIDSIPAQLPPQGAPVPVRVERLRSGLSGAVTPQSVRLLPARIPADTVPSRSREIADDSAAVRDPSPR